METPSASISDTLRDQGPCGPPRGEGHGNAKLTEEVVRQIREAHAAGLGGYHRIARVVGVSPSQVQRVVKRLAWAHVK